MSRWTERHDDEDYYNDREYEEDCSPYDEEEDDGTQDPDYEESWHDLEPKKAPSLIIENLYTNSI